MLAKITPLIFLFAFSATCLSQQLRSKVVDENNEPLRSATVYFDGTSRGVITDLDGFFNIEVPSGVSKPILVISYLGYTSQYIQNLENLKPVYQLQPNPESLNNVDIYTTLFTRKQMEKVFLKYFLGEGKAANQCNILNLDDVNLYYVAENNTLYASSLNPIVIQNKYLGYTVKFELLNFEVNYSQKTLSDNYAKQSFYAGTTFFKDNNPDKKRNREKVYKRSLTNFFRNLVDSTLQETKYKLAHRGFVRNPYNVFKVETSDNPEVNVARIRLRRNYIKVVNGKFINTKFLLVYKGQHTTLILKKPYFRVDLSGNLIDIKDVVLSGGLAEDRVAKMLPLNYKPSN